MTDQHPRLLDRVRAALRRKQYALRTEEAYVSWVRRYALFHHKRHPQELGAPEVEAVLTHLAVHAHVAASTQTQALSALLFLYNEVLHQPLDASLHIVYAKHPERVPTVLTHDEVQRVLAALTDTYRVMAQVLYGSGLRLMECVRLRVKDVDFSQRQIVVRDGKGAKDSDNHAARQACGAASGTGGACAAAVSTRLQRQPRACLSPRCIGAQVPQRES